MRLLLLLIVLSMSSFVLAQPRKLPAFSFQDQSLAFADANQTYSSTGSYTQTDTLPDSLILSSLVQILSQNEEILIEIGGHTAVNEESTLGLERAQLIRKRLISEGIDPARLNVVNYAHSKPIIQDDVLLSLPTPTEKDAANQKNRRVEINVRGIIE